MDATLPMLKVLLSLFSVVVPTKMWFAPGQAITVKVSQPSTLVLTTFDGQVVATQGPVNVPADTATDLRTPFPALNTPGTYVLFADPQGKSSPADFVGTPIVVEVLNNKDQGGTTPMVVKLEPLQYVQMTTAAGPMTMDLSYDVAPNTVDSFLRLSGEGYYDGLTFHRIVPGFVIQGGDPTGTGGGGPGYSINAEFNAKQHQQGVLSMARTSDPNSAGSQFFVCLDYAQTQQLDNKYTVFGKVVDGMPTVTKIAGTPLSDPQNGTPATPQVIDKAEVLPVTPGHNPYAAMGLGK